MIKFVKESKRLIYFASFLIKINKRVVNVMRPSFAFFINDSSQIRLYSAFQNKNFLISNDQLLLTILRNKSQHRSKKHGKYRDEESSDEEEEEDDDDDDDDDGVDNDLEKNSDLKMHNVSSLRTDLILKTILGISRKKVEEHFYANKIRINGKVLLKKSYNVQVGDEIDLIKKVEDYSSDTLNVGRIKIHKIKFDKDINKFVVKASKSKSLLIKNYDGADSWQEPEELN